MRSILNLLFVMTCLTARLMANERLAIFYPTVQETREIQKVLGSDDALHGVSTSAFAKFDDFTFALEAENFQFAILPSVTPRFLPEFEPLLQFTVSNSRTFKYSVISIDSKWDKSRLSEGIAGIVDEVGRKNIKFHVEGLMAGKRFKRIKKVGKLVDLFPLLSLGNVDYILIAPGDLDSLKKDFATKTYKIVDTIDVNYPVLCAKKGYDARSAERFEKMSKATLKALGFDGITRISK